MKKIINLIAMIILLTGCATVEKKLVVDKNESGFASKLSFMTNDKGEKWMELTSSLIDPAVISGEYSTDESGDLVFDIKKLRFYTSWVNGWTEGEYNAIGKLKFHSGDGGAHCTVIDKFEIGEIEKGTIRFYDDFLMGEKGLDAVRNRFDRIQAVNSYLKTKGFREFYNHAWLDKKPDRISFKSGTLKFLFPELAINSALTGKDVSSDLKITNPLKEISLKETVAWNKLYTQKTFPDNLKEVRNSGTMLRDYEEALKLFYMDYNMDYYFGKVLENEVFKEKIK
jgi:hypothetical protein